ncbi:MAG: tyrosine-type recombinase/integrase [Gammaproteobacteria bacterium]|nr:tyrosine-type recombinase/integrase [Gammaproteobacteria bacterium]
MHTPFPFFDTLPSLKDQDFRQQQQQLASQLTSGELAQDLTQAWDFLLSYRGSEATFNAYRREIERLLQWAWFVAQKSLRNLRRLDIETFIEFCQKPPKSWIGTKQVARFVNQNAQRIPNPEWRPFVTAISKKAHSEGQVPNINQYILSQNALQAIFSILGSFYNYLIQEEYTEVNPIALIRQKSKYLRKHQTQQVVRRLSELQWIYVIETAEKLANDDPAKHERTLFIMNALYGMYLRISELASSERWQPSMGHFHCDTHLNWWFTTVGKGNKERIVSVSDAMLAALKRYRKSLGLSPTPAPADKTPLISKIHGVGPITSTREIRHIVQHCFDEAIHRLQQDGLGEEAETLMSATVHWLRHTGISDDVKHRPREHVRDDAGHGSSAITDKYIDIELRERHASARKKQLKPE